MPPRSSAHGRIHDRIHACLLAGAAGDALGWPVAPLSWPEIRARHGPDGLVAFDPDAPGGAGAVTDDTQLTLFTAEGLLRASAGASGAAFVADAPAWEPIPDDGLHRIGEGMPAS